jgi:hypothetical protein
MMIASGGDEGRTGAHALHQLKTQHAAIEAERAVEIGDLQVNVADSGAGVDGWILRHAAPPFLYRT